MNMLYHLQYETVLGNGSFIIFSKKEGLKREDLTDLQAKMLQLNSIPHLLPIEIEEDNLKVRLRYTTTSKERLSHAVKNKGLTLKNYFKLLFNIISILDDSKIYLLDENHYLLYQDFIFIDRDFNEIYLLYLPIKNLKGKDTVQSELKQLSIDLIRFVKDLKGDEFQKLMSVFYGDEFHLSQLKERLLLLFNENDLSETNEVVQSETPNKAKKGKEKDRQKQKQSVKQRKETEGEKETKAKKETKEARELAPLTERQKVILFVISFFITALLWKFYLIRPDEGWFFITVGLTVLVADMDLIILKIWRPSFKRRQSSISLSPSESKIEKPKTKGKPGSVSYYQNLKKETTILAKADETVWLNEDHEKNTLPEAFLQVNRGGKMEEIRISGKHFLIGRDPLVVNYVENSRGISRLHLEIEYKETGYQVRDLASKNGSYLNQQKLLPNIFYPLRKGDVLKIAAVEFIFSVNEQVKG